MNKTMFVGDKMYRVFSAAVERY